MTTADCEWRVSSQQTADTRALLAREWSGWGSGVGKGAGKGAGSCGRWQIRLVIFVLQRVYLAQYVIILYDL